MLKWFLSALLIICPLLSNIAHANEDDPDTSTAFHPNRVTNENWLPFEERGMCDDETDLNPESNKEIGTDSTGHPGELAEVPPYVKANTTISTEIMNHIKGTRHFKKKRGINDPHFPLDISFKPNKVPLPTDLSISGIESAIEDGYLNLYCLTHNLLKNLSQKDITTLFAYLGTQKIKVNLKCRGKWHAHPINSLLWDKTNAAAGVTLRLGIQRKCSMFSKLISLAPDAILPELKEKAPCLLSTRVTATTLISMMKQLDHKNTANISRSAAGIVYIYIKYWSGKDAEQMNKHLTKLVLQIHSYNGNLKELTPKQLGVLLGSLLAGTLAHCSKIKSGDIQKQWLVNSSSNLIWAASTFLGAVPWFAGNAAILLVGTIDIAVVSAAVTYNILRVPRNYASMVRAVEGEIKISALDLADKHSTERRQDVSEMLEWLDAVIELNGQPA